jgi:hypothetical protein
VLNKRLEAIAAYLKQVGKDLARGDSTEHTHRPALQQLIQQLQKGIVCVNEPKGSSSAGHPDMKVLLGETPLGFIETKDVGLYLDEIADTPQLKRYREHIPNLILTDYVEFRWYQNGNLADTVRLATVLDSGRLRRIDGSGEAILTLLDSFLTADVKTVGSPKELAQRMATLAKWVRRVIVESFEAESAGQELHSQLKAFREVLLPDLDVPKFADMYAQTICYGLFAGKCNADPGIAFVRDNAASYLPRTNPFLRRLFSSIMAGDLNEKVAGAIDAITFLLDHSDIASILKDFGKRTRQEDPVVHFYETFLAAYDPKLRKTRGVYYTPEPVVSYIVRSVDWLLKEKFGKKEGLADPSVLVLDPACGTGTFLYHVIKLIHERVKAKGQYGSWSSYVRDSLLPRVFGFELLMAPYAVAHLKLGLLLQDTGYDFSSDERLGIFLTNTLEEAARKSDVLFANYISDEANAATDIKRDKPIMVVLGNPPYSGVSANKNNWIDGLLHGQLPGDSKTGSYYEVDGKPLGEKKLWLQDDYVKFIRWSQWRIERTGYGVHAYISNNGYLDNPTFRGMRQCLERAFDESYVLDLHGSSMKKEVAPDGSPDGNVFDIRQGVCIGIFVKHDSSPLRGAGRAQGSRVFHSDFWGTREAKYRILATSSLDRTTWNGLSPAAPFYLWSPVDDARWKEYEPGVSLPDVMPTAASGVVTAADELLLDNDRNALLERMRAFADVDTDDGTLIERFGLSRNLRARLADVRRSLRDIGNGETFLKRILYRPFDVKWIFYHRGIVWNPRSALMSHMRGSQNLGMSVSRSVRGEPWRDVLASRCMIEFGLIATRPGNSAPLMPLYLYPNTGLRGRQHRLDDTEVFPWPSGKDGRVPNLSPRFVAEMKAKLGLEFVSEQPEAVSGKPSAASPFGPEDVFNYIYAILHSPTYRKRYAEFLKIDFPRVPLTSDKRLFWKLVALGRELVALHLLESPKVNDLVTKYPEQGPDTVEKVAYDENKTRVLINDEQYFEGVRPEWFEFHVGGYQVLQKWLKDRKGRKLTNDDITHYQRVVVAIKETIHLMAEIDQAIPQWPIP